MKKKTLALLLTAFVIPGLGQLYLGRKKMGVFLIVAVNFLLLLAFCILLKGSAPLVAAHITSASIKPEDIAAGLNIIMGYARPFLIVFALIWGYAITDILIKPAPEQEPN